MAWVRSKFDGQRVSVRTHTKRIFAWITEPRHTLVITLPAFRARHLPAQAEGHTSSAGITLCARQAMQAVLAIKEPRAGFTFGGQWRANVTFAREARGAKCATRRGTGFIEPKLRGACTRARIGIWGLARRRVHAFAVGTRKAVIVRNAVTVAHALPGLPGQVHGKRSHAKRLNHRERTQVVLALARELEPAPRLQLRQLLPARGGVSFVESIFEGSVG